jgi:hypothetical protein
MISIKYLFEDINFDSVPKKYKKRVARKCKILKDFEKDIPNFKYPLLGTNKFEEELDEVKRCVISPSLNKSFLKLSDQGSEDVFRKVITKDYFDWPSLKNVLKELDALLLRLKFKYDRKRPYVHFEERGDNLETESAGSPSFPSGHTAFAYFLCDYFSHLFPEKTMQLQTLAEMIGQSRIENGVHFPSDVSVGRFIGEQAAKYALENKQVEESVNSRSHQKTFIKFLRKRAQDTRPKFKRNHALEAYANDMSLFVANSTNENVDKCYLASRSILEGYQISQCSESEKIVRFFEAMIHTFYRNQSSSMDLFRLHSVLCAETVIRNEEKSTLSGISYAPVNKINMYLENACSVKDKPFLKLAYINWVEPFTTGNKELTNLIFLKETGFNFDITNQIIIDELDFMLEKFYVENHMEMLLS